MTLSGCTAILLDMDNKRHIRNVQIWQTFTLCIQWEMDLFEILKPCYVLRLLQIPSRLHVCSVWSQWESTALYRISYSWTKCEFHVPVVELDQHLIFISNAFLVCSMKEIIYNAAVTNTQLELCNWYWKFLGCIYTLHCAVLGTLCLMYMSIGRDPPTMFVFSLEGPFKVILG